MKKTALLFSVVASLSWGAQVPEFSGRDAQRQRVSVQLLDWATDLPQVTEIAFVPGSDRVLVLLKQGDLVSLSQTNPKDRVTLLHLDVLTSSEMGLLGIAFHPRFAGNRKIYLHYNPAKGDRRARIAEWVWPADTSPPLSERVLLEIPQPYPNHKGGKLLFGSDGFLYIGMGDGGLAADPHDNGQSTKSLLGKMLRIDVDKRSGGRPYAIPASNPFATEKKYSPEIWAMGLRNPWRFSFDRRGRLIVADVGQNQWEEVSIVEAGGNYGWRIKEASHCFNPDKNCPGKGLTDPWLEYGRDDGASITGGYVYTGKAIPALKGKYVFGDFVSGRIWAAEPPASTQQSAHSQTFAALGKWNISLSTFGQDAQGELYVADFARGSILKLAP